MTVTYDFTGKTAFVTGGSAGIGAKTVRAFAEAGAELQLSMWTRTQHSTLRTTRRSGTRSAGAAVQRIGRRSRRSGSPGNRRGFRQPGYGIQQCRNHASSGRFR